MSDPALYIGLRPAGPLGQVTLRADLSDPALASAVHAATGLSVPGKLGVTHDSERRAIWMSPDELLLIGPKGQASDVVEALQQALSGHHHMALDVSDARTVFRLSGADVDEVLAKGAPCDLSDRACPPGTARRTHLAGLAVALWRLEAETWEIACFRSYTHHLSAWLHSAAAKGAEVG